MRFQPLTDFTAEIQGRRMKYVKGLSYTARPEDTKLRQLMVVWQREGKIELLPAAPPSVKVSGSMTLGRMKES